MTYGMVVILNFFEKPEALQIRHHLVAAGEAIKAPIGSGRLVHHAAVVHHLEHLQAVSLAYLVIVAVMGRGHLQGAGTELHLGMLVEDQRDDPVSQRQPDADPGQVTVALVIGMHRHTGIAEHGLGPGSGHHHVARAIGIGIAHMVELALGVLVLDLVVGQGCLAAGAPVDNIVAFVDQAFLEQTDKDFAHRLRQALIHGKSLALPVAGRTEFLQLVDDRAAFFLPPLPNFVDKGLAPQLVPAFTLACQLPFNDILGGDTGMVRSRNPHGVIPAHTVITGQDILQSVVEGMTDMQHSCDVRRRDNDGE